MVGAGWDGNGDLATFGYLLFSGGVIFGPSWEVATIQNRVIRDRAGTISVAPTFSPSTGTIGFAARVRF